MRFSLALVSLTAVLANTKYAFAMARIRRKAVTDEFVNRARKLQDCVDVEATCGDFAEFCSDEDYEEFLRDNCAKTCAFCASEPTAQLTAQPTALPAAQPTATFDTGCMDFEAGCADMAEWCQADDDYGVWMEGNCMKTCNLCPGDSSPTPPLAQPTAQLAAQPTAQPTALSTAQPTALSTAQPTAQPTALPTAQPTAQPTALSTAQPTAATSTAQPTALSTAQPTALSTAEPTAQPTAQPTALPAAQPTTTPDISGCSGMMCMMYCEHGFKKGEDGCDVCACADPEPDESAPTTALSQPTAQPTALPTAQPTAQPTAEPTAEPTAQPTAQPTALPTAQPTALPTEWATSDTSDDAMTSCKDTVTGDDCDPLARRLLFGVNGGECKCD